MPAIVTFELNATGPNVIVEINTGGDNSINALEIFSEWKQWLLDDPTRLGLPQAFSVEGGQPKTATTELGQAFFMHSPDWVFRPAEHDHKLTIVGDIGVLGGVGSFLVPTLGGYTVLVELERSALITGLAMASPLTSQEVRDAMKLAPTAGAPGSDSIDDQLAALEAAVAAVPTTLEAAHGAGSWLTASGFAQPGDAMTIAGADATRLLELWQLRGLDIINPAVHAPTSINFAGVTLAITEDAGTYTVQRS